MPASGITNVSTAFHCCARNQEIVACSVLMVRLHAQRFNRNNPAAGSNFEEVPYFRFILSMFGIIYDLFSIISSRLKPFNSYGITSHWLKFPHSLEGLTEEEVKQNRPNLYQILQTAKV